MTAVYTAISDGDVTGARILSMRSDVTAAYTRSRHDDGTADRITERKTDDSYIDAATHAAQHISKTWYTIGQ